MVRRTCCWRASYVYRCNVTSCVSLSERQAFGSQKASSGPTENVTFAVSSFADVVAPNTSNARVNISNIGRESIHKGEECKYSMASATDALGNSMVNVKDPGAFTFGESVDDRQLEIAFMSHL